MLFPYSDSKTTEINMENKIKLRSEYAVLVRGYVFHRCYLVLLAWLNTGSTKHFNRFASNNIPGQRIFASKDPHTLISCLSACATDECSFGSERLSTFDANYPDCLSSSLNFSELCFVQTVGNRLKRVIFLKAAC